MIDFQDSGCPPENVAGTREPKAEKLSPSARPRSGHTPLLSRTELAAAKREHAEVQEQIREALDEERLSDAVRLTNRARELDRVVFGQPWRVMNGGAA